MDWCVGRAHGASCKAGWLKRRKTLQHLCWYWDEPYQDSEETPSRRRRFELRVQPLRVWSWIGSFQFGRRGSVEELRTFNRRTCQVNGTGQLWIHREGEDSSPAVSSCAVGRGSSGADKMAGSRLDTAGTTRNTKRSKFGRSVGRCRSPSSTTFHGRNYLEVKFGPLPEQEPAPDQLTGDAFEIRSLALEPCADVSQLTLHGRRMPKSLKHPPVVDASS